jgi:hypothetical protein
MPEVNENDGQKGKKRGRIWQENYSSNSIEHFKIMAAASSVIFIRKLWVHFANRCCW